MCFLLHRRGRGFRGGRGGNRGGYRHDNRPHMQHDQYYQQGPPQSMGQSQSGYHDGNQYMLPSNRYDMFDYFHYYFVRIDQLINDLLCDVKFCCAQSVVFRYLVI